MPRQTQLPTKNKRLVKRRVKSVLAQAILDCRTEHPRSRQRTLCYADATRTVADRRFTEALLQWRPGVDAIEIRIHGGFVANSYDYRAESDEASVTVLPNGRVAASCERHRAQKRPHGRGEHTVYRIREPRHVNGRIIS